MNSTAIIQAENHSGLKNLLLVLGVTFLIALSGRISIPLPFTPVPIAIQNHVCLLTAVLLGRRLGTLSISLFLLMGALGLPVFAMGGAGLPILLGPRGGYLIGYLLAAWVTATLIEKRQLSSPRLKTLAMGLGNLVIYACGLPQLAIFVGVEKVMLLGMVPFLAGDLIKLFISYRFIKGTSD
jgi:biotin transport system substrate-specific component